MKRIDLLRARIALYRRYLREGADGDLASAYLWLIRKDEIELTALVETLTEGAVAEADEAGERAEALPPDT